MADPIQEASKALSQSIMADIDAADALAAQSLKDGTARITDAFAEGWNAGGLDQWLKSRARAEASPKSPESSNK